MANDHRSAKGDYSGSATTEPLANSVPKSIYLTPKGDRLRPSKPVPVEPPVQPPMVEDLEQDEDYPEISVPFDPHVTRPGELERAVRPQKTPSAAKARPIDIAARNGRLIINRYHTLKLDMAHGECRKFPEFITADYDLPKRAIETLADNLMIIQKRICAENGAIMVTCYQNEATISLRRAKPDDGCAN